MARLIRGAPARHSVSIASMLWLVSHVCTPALLAYTGTHIQVKELVGFEEVLVVVMEQLLHHQSLFQHIDKHRQIGAHVAKEALRCLAQLLEPLVDMGPVSTRGPLSSLSDPSFYLQVVRMINRSVSVCLCLSLS